LTALVTEQQQFESANAASITAYQAEIQRATSALSSNPSDIELQKAKSRLERELQPLLTKRGELQASIADLNGATAGKIPLKQKEQSAQVGVGTGLRNQMLEIELKLKKSRLNQIKILSQLNGIDDAIAKIRLGVRFAAMKDSDQMLEHSEILGLFNIEFSKQLTANQLAAGGSVPTEPVVQIGPANILMLKMNGEWRGVCDDNFDQNDLIVACKMLGKQAVSFKTVAGSSEKFWLDELQCNGSEKSLFECKHAGIGVDDCQASEAIAVECK
jgi:hypothetical protein